MARIVSGVTASRALIEAAIAAGADALLVHHGLFWRGQDGRVVGWMRERLRLLLAHDINLYASICRWMPTRNWAITLNWARCWAGSSTNALASKTGLRGAGQVADAPTLAHWVQQRLGRSVTCVPRHTGAADLAAWRGARVGRRGILSQPWQRVCCFITGGNV